MHGEGLDVVQRDAAAAVAGQDRLVLVVLGRRLHDVPGWPEFTVIAFSFADGSDVDLWLTAQTCPELSNGTLTEGPLVNGSGNDMQAVAAS